MNNQNISEEERNEAATEEPATVGCPSLGIPKLSGGADGVGPGKVSDVARAKLEQSVVRMRAKLTQIADLALAAEAKSGSEHVKLGSKYLENSKAIAEIRRICKASMVEEVVPDYEWLAKIMTGEHFEPECLAKAIEAEASKRPIEYPTFYTPGWLARIAKWLRGNQNANIRKSDESTRKVLEHLREDSPDSLDSRSEAERRHTMDFGRFHVTRAAIPGRTILTFRRKQEHLAEFGTVVPGRIIVAEIYKQDDCGEGVSNHFVVKSCVPGESPRVLFAGDSWVSMSKTEKIVYRMVKCNIKETQRRHITRKRKRDAAKAAGEGK